MTIMFLLKLFQSQKIQEFFSVKFSKKSWLVKFFWNKFCQLFSYCPGKRSQSFWIFVWIFFLLNEDCNFWKYSSIVFRHHFYKPFENICKNDDETRCWNIFKNCSFHSIKKKFKQRFKNFGSFSLDNKKIIDRTCFKKILTTSTFHIISHK